jgi:hypothetical protein
MKDFTATNAEFESIDISEKFQVSESGAIGGVIPSGVNDIIKWDGSQWIAGINPGGNGGGGGGSGVADPFTTNLISGQSLQNISFNQTLDSAPSIATDLEIDGDGSIIPYTISGLSTTGYTAIFAEEIPNNNYKIHTVFGGGSSSGGSELSGEELRAINKTIVDSPVDVFVYDTSRDSDGGAWRKRTQNTSWYNEELNTATRGARREFPAVAVIVAEADKVTIYDGDDPDLSMWMVFNAVSSMNLITNSTVSSITALNGVVGVACNETSPHFTPIDFISEKSGHYTISGNKYFLFDISKRNNTSNPAHGSYDGAVAIVNSSVNDVAMTVLPNAPIDDDTGLPVPTIAVATDGGVSVIKDDGTVVNSDETNKVRTVHFNKNELLISTLVDFDNVRIYSFSSSIDKLYEYWAGSSDGFWHLANAHNSTYSSIFTENTSANILGLTKFDLEKNKNDSSMCYITSKYNTGWMPGDIKLAALSDTTVETIGTDSSELVTNGDFSTDSDWTKGTGWSIVGGIASKVSSADSSNLTQEIHCLIGQTYVVSWDITSRDSSVVGFYTQSGGSITAVQNYYESVGSYSETFTATSESVTIALRAGSTAFLSVDNISVRPAEADRSVNNKGLQIVGEINKTPVASGADLVAYSGFSGNNYLMQSYNADLDFGTGDFYVMAWIKDFAINGDYQRIFGRGIDGSTGFEWDLYFHISSPELRLRTYSNGVSNGDVYLDYISNMSVGSWNQIVLLRKSGMLSMYINGVKTEYGDQAFDYNMSNPGASLYIGNRFTPSDSNSFNGSIALARISKTAPTPEQIARIYRDEKVLFQEGAQSTLYGTSDAVTALAYDDSEQLLHVGTASGRSDFRGLARVNNTTTAISNSISAAEGTIIQN